MASKNLSKKKTSPAKAIREMCIECMGGRGSGQNYSKLIAECGSPCCPAFAFRFGTNPHKKTKTLTREHKQALLNGRKNKTSASSLSV